METVATVCGYCGVGCGMELHVADGVVTKATGRADHPANRGRLCTKGNTTADMLRAGGRLTTALVRPERGADAAPTDVDARQPYLETQGDQRRDRVEPSPTKATRPKIRRAPPRRTTPGFVVRWIVRPPPKRSGSPGPNQ